MKQKILDKIKDNGGWCNAHAHIDRAYTLRNNELNLCNATLHQKWDIIKTLKQNSKIPDIFARMGRAIEDQISQGVTSICSFIDVDSISKDKNIQAAQLINEAYGKDIDIKWANQVILGVVDKKERDWFNVGAEFCDIIGGLPGKDDDKVKHLDILFSKAKELDKKVHVHVDQNNSESDNNETGLLIKKVKEYYLQDRVTAIHSVSIATRMIKGREAIYKGLFNNGISVITCPVAWIDSRRTEEMTPTHNSITPVEEMLKFNVNCAIGTDNINDLFKPFATGDMWTELYFLLESLHLYDIDNLVKIATVNGRKCL
jgi:cytosine/adenosine deaminase-related metal-dependent hydrolase